MFGREWRVGRVGGVPIYLQTSLAVLALLLVFQMWGWFSDPFAFPGLGSGVAAGLAVLTAVLFVGSILAHELGHTLVSLARGIPVARITLFMLGGLTHQRTAPQRALDEFLITAVGPAASGLVGLGFLALHAAGRSTFSRPVFLMFGVLAEANLLMAAFNLLPAFPLDGGRLLLSGLWRVTRDRSKAQAIAARIGQGVAALIVVAGIILAATTEALVFGLWAALIGWTLFQGASATLAERSRHALLHTTRARDVMSLPPPAVPAAMSVEEAIERYLKGHEGEAFPVVAGGHAVGFVSLRTIRGVPPGRPVSEGMVGPGAVVEAGSEEPMDVVTDRLGERQVQTVLVFDEGRLVGVIEPEDINRMLRRHRALARMARGQPEA